MNDDHGEASGWLQLAIGPTTGASAVMGNVYLRQQPLHLTMLAILAGLSIFQPAIAVESTDELAKRVGIRVLSDATSESDVRDRTAQGIPYRRMSRSARQRATDIVEDVSQYRRMPCLQYQVDPNIYQYLVNNPDVAVSTWRVMGISKLEMWQTTDFEYEAKAGDGSEGIADVLWRDANQCLFIVEGRYRSPLLPSAIEASALVWLRYRFVKGENGKILVNQQVDTYIHFPSTAIDTIAKLARRVTNTILDRNVFEVSLYARMMSRAAEKEPEWIEQLAQRMDGVPRRRSTELIQVSRGINPYGSNKLLPGTSNGVSMRTANRLPQSGEFRNFESSLKKVSTHAAITPSEIRHQPSYGKKIGASSAYMSKPRGYETPESPKAIAIQEARRMRALHYNLYYSDSNIEGATDFAPVAAVPPESTADLNEAPETSTESARLIFMSPKRNQQKDGKADSGQAAQEYASPQRPGNDNALRAIPVSRKRKQGPSKPADARAPRDSRSSQLSTEAR